MGKIAALCYGHRRDASRWLWAVGYRIRFGTEANHRAYHSPMRASGLLWTMTSVRIVLQVAEDSPGDYTLTMGATSPDGRSADDTYEHGVVEDGELRWPDGFVFTEGTNAETATLERGQGRSQGQSARHASSDVRLTKRESPDVAPQPVHSRNPRFSEELIGQPPRRHGRRPELRRIGLSGRQTPVGPTPAVQRASSV